ncbi:P-loop containing nucleoside triphosphate hydrolase protein [Eremomyces bilateralis CBS 781.70]|uniref:P-loop containing nucleoside triphosphate hydrolase protein n=1 Tax=Eremomyces bilateralis CBS 781.70 TaxID=1392243 RepID=A0A6G1G227_9PEZI|nr:P-loop containing nucleoside triphosphate hydrolase protein [Eremomyces bilateralis CBS 781.70]KAF1811980.1 P-loop containing nucleoside triphosphate hydrolase protein [Eremomyces bilateralis CBS 781.70]
MSAIGDEKKIPPTSEVDDQTTAPNSTADVEKVLASQAPAPVVQDGEALALSKLDSKVEVPKDENDPFKHLPDHERAILKRQLDTPDVQVGYTALYRYATRNDLIILVVSAIMAIGAGAALPLMTIIFGQLAGQFQDFFNGNASLSAFKGQLGGMILYFVYLAIGEFVATYIATAGFIYVGEHIAQKVREHYLAAMLRQNIAFFDMLGAGEITTRITADTNLVQDGISEKVGLTLTAIATFLTAFVIGFVKYWKLTLIMSSVVFAIVAVMGAGSTFIVKWSTKAQESYAKGGSVAEEVLSSIRNATAFNTQDKLAKQYDIHLQEAEKWGKKMQSVLGIMVAGMMTLVYLSYGLAFWEGSRLLVAGETNLADLLTILFAVIIGAFAIGNVAPNAKAFTTGVAAAQKIYSAIDRVSPIDPTRDEGKKLDTFEGTVELRNIKHIYPSRPEVVVMDGINLMVPAGKTTALVGASGSGKSTVVGLVERFYDPVGGEVLLDGHNVQDLSLKWLRQHVSLVQQEPILFATTIQGNIRHGLLGTPHEHLSEEETTKLVEAAARQANAHDFITNLPEGYQTHVGERGFLLSGGQKQRIAIARAMVSDPKILLLDEATSALDTKSEGVVQAALDTAAKGRTTIVIAHRLSTIKTADNIVVMQEGRIVEQGTHDDLLETKGAYYNLVEAQRLAADTDAAAATESEDASILDQYNGEKLGMRTSGSDENGQGFEADPDDDDPARLRRIDTGKSKASVELAKKKPEEEQRYGLWVLIKTTASFNAPEWHVMVAGVIFSIISGCGNPTQAVFFAKNIAALSLPPPQYGELRSEVNFWSLMYLMLAFVQLIGFVGSGLTFAYCSEKLTHRARDRAFRNMLRQDIAFFDKDENTAGALTSFLSTETTHLAGLSGSTLGTILLVSTTLIAATTLAIALAWKLGLVCTATIPVLLFCGFLRFWMLARFQARAKKAYEASAGYACEATSAIRTVASLTREADVWENYHQQLVDQGQKSLNSVLKSSSLYAASQSLSFLCFALGFWYGGQLIATGEYSMFQFFVAFTAVIFGAQSAGTIFSFAPDMGKAKQAATEMKRLFDRTPAIDSWSTDGEQLKNIDGSIEFRDVHFRYPTRPETPVLRGLNLTVQPGQYVALVGASGCGKSTTIALLERFYDPLVGGIYVDGKEISSMNINNYRNFLALVSQEPTLYQGTIRENILLGADNPDVTEDEIVKACQDANIYEFVMSLPDGFNTVCGSKGTLLSGGQKQRIAIARALIRNPRILLLDEATSALDSESEKVVQAALDAAAKGRTTIAVAHRLSTIQKADVIYVIDQGRVVEQGTHSELLAKKGRYAELVTLQGLGKTH